MTSGQEYQLRIEEYRGFNLDWLLPLAAASMRIPNRALRLGTLVALGGAWFAARQRGLDPLVRFDPSHAEGHTHHISAAMRMVGDTSMALGPQPARKWAGLGPLGNALSAVLAKRGHENWAAVAAFAGAIGSIFGLIGFRRPERALDTTAREFAPSFGLGTILSLLTLLLNKDK